MVIWVVHDVNKKSSLSYHGRKRGIKYKMKEIKLMLSVLVLALAILTTLGTSQDSWNLGSSEDWLSTSPVYHNGPFYYPNGDRNPTISKQLSWPHTAQLFE